MLQIFMNVVFCSNFMLQNKSGKISVKSYRLYRLFIAIYSGLGQAP